MRIDNRFLNFQTPIYVCNESTSTAMSSHKTPTYSALLTSTYQICIDNCYCKKLKVIVYLK